MLQKEQKNQEATKQTQKKRQIGRQTNRKLGKRDKKYNFNIVFPAQFMRYCSCFIVVSINCHIINVEAQINKNT